MSFTIFQRIIEKYSKFVLTDAIEVYIIELPKLTKYEKNTPKERLNLWVNFIKNPEVSIVMSEIDDEKTKETKETREMWQKKC